MSEALLIAIVGAAGLLLGAVLNASTQVFKWKNGESQHTDATTVESYAKAANTAADTNTRLLEQINQMRNDLNSALERIETLENERREWEITRLNLEKRIRNLETENAQLRQQRRANGLATND